MTIQLLLVCHGSTEAARAAAFPRDEPLDRFGVADAAAARPALPAQVDQCWSGPEQRARQTAEALGLNIVVAPALTDWDCGRWAGVSMSELQGREPDALGVWLTSPDAAPHGGESLHQLLSRVGRWMDQLTPEPDRAGRTRIIAVTHPAIVRAAIVYAVNGTAASFWRIDVGPLSRAELSGRDGRWSLRAISRFGRADAPIADAE